MPAKTSAATIAMSRTSVIRKLPLMPPRERSAGPAGKAAQRGRAERSFCLPAPRRQAARRQPSGTAAGREAAILRRGAGLRKRPGWGVIHSARRSPTPGARRPYDGRLAIDRSRDLRLAARGDALLRAGERLLRRRRVRARQGAPDADP